MKTILKFVEPTLITFITFFLMSATLGIMMHILPSVHGFAQFTYYVICACFQAFVFYVILGAIVNLFKSRVTPNQA